MSESYLIVKQWAKTGDLANSDHEINVGEHLLGP
jgi:hypothetical protein